MYDYLTYKAAWEAILPVLAPITLACLAVIGGVIWIEYDLRKGGKR